MGAGAAGVAYEGHYGGRMPFYGGGYMPFPFYFYQPYVVEQEEPSQTTPTTDNSTPATTTDNTVKAGSAQPVSISIFTAKNILIAGIVVVTSYVLFFKKNPIFKLNKS